MSSKLIGDGRISPPLAVNPHGDKPAWRLITNQLTTSMSKGDEPTRMKLFAFSVVSLLQWQFTKLIKMISVCISLISLICERRSIDVEGVEQTKYKTLYRWNVKCLWLRQRYYFIDSEYVNLSCILASFFIQCSVGLLLCVWVKAQICMVQMAADATATHYLLFQ